MEEVVTGKSSPFTFDVWQCPTCNWAMSDAAYMALAVNINCPNCNVTYASGFHLRKARKDSESNQQQIKKA